MITSTSIQETAAAAAFSKQALVFDELYGGDLIIQYKRERVRQQVESFLPSAATILELNAGTGEDAFYFAERGHTIHATDIAEGMQTILKEKANKKKINRVTTECISYTHLNELKNKGPYDLIFSNFAGLNCTDQLEKVLASFSPLLKPGGHIVLVLLPRFCAWEFLLLFRGKFKTAFRRFSGKKGTASKIDGQYFRCWYYNPSYVRKRLKKEFRVVHIQGLCTIVPPSYMEKFGEKHPRLFNGLKKLENKLKSAWPWRSIGDYYIITLQKKP